MADYIDRQTALDEFQSFGSVWMAYTDDMPTEKIAWMALKNAKRSMIDVLNGLPPADVEPVRHGYWIKDRLVSTSGGTYGVRRCSECESYYQDVGYGFYYCPNCGARMDGEQND